MDHLTRKLTDHERSDRIELVELTAATLMKALSIPGWTITETTSVYAIGAELAKAAGGHRPTSRPERVDRDPAEPLAEEQRRYYLAALSTAVTRLGLTLTAAAGYTNTDRTRLARVGVDLVIAAQSYPEGP